MISQNYESITQTYNISCIEKEKDFRTIKSLY